MTKDEVLRYSRQVLVPGIGRTGQEKLFDCRVLVIGAGGLGSPALFYLAGAGAGTGPKGCLGIVDSDRVELSNLQRQILHTAGDIGRLKTESAEEKIKRLNPGVHVNTYPIRADRANILDIMAGYDIVIDGTDTFESKFFVNDSCVKAGKPFVHSGIMQTKGQVMTWVPGTAGSGCACYRCVFDAPPPEGVVPSCAQAGVLGMVAGIMGCVQAAEAVKYITGMGELLTDRIWVLDTADMVSRIIPVRRRASCPACGKPA
jgi:molybdopterin-synthase adenylyltransferase